MPIWPGIHKTLKPSCTGLLFYDKDFLLLKFNVNLNNVCSLFTWSYINTTVHFKFLQYLIYCIMCPAIVLTYVYIDSIQIPEVYLFAFAYKPFHDDFSPIYGANLRVLPEQI